MRVGGAGPTFGRVPERRKRHEEDPPDHVPRPSSRSRSARPACSLALGAFGGSIDDPAVAPCLRPPTTVEPPRVVLDHREVARPLHLQRRAARGDAVPPAAAGAASGRRVGARQRRTASALLRAAGRVIRRGRDRVLLLRQARRRRVGGQLLPGRARPLQPRHRRRGRRDRGRPLLVERRRRAGRLRRRERSRLDRAARGRGVGARRVHRAREPRRAPAQPRRAVRARGGGAATEHRRRARAADPLLEAVRLRPDAVPRAPRRPGALALRRRRPQRARAPQRRAARSIKQQRSKDWTIVIFPGAGHGLLRRPAHRPARRTTAEAWIRRHVVVRPERTQPATS